MHLLAEACRPYASVNFAHRGSPGLAFVITQPCIGTKDASCIEVCPLDCIHAGDASAQYFIDPDECIDCGACVDTCPVDAIYPEDEVPAEWTSYIKLNAEYFRQ
jgi:ferredoxin